MSNWQIGPVILPGDLEWIDEFRPLRRQSESLSLAGGSIVQRSTQLTGIPITLQTPPRVFVTRQQITDLLALVDDAQVDTFLARHPDGRDFTCRFRHRDGQPVDWANTFFRSPPQATDGWHTLTLRLMTA